MKASKILIGIAAALLTSANLGVIYLSASAPSKAIERIDGIKVTELAPVNVYPTADEWRAADMLVSDGVAGIVTLPLLGGLNRATARQGFSLIGSQLAMPYYSFGNKFGRTNKE
ncbi:MAG: hypothetical protein EPN74_15370 [Rhodanobacter sp.]|nr:MAG: hypothetical protein EPN74_15370 [Rhodanobacter sp.]